MSVSPTPNRNDDRGRARLPETARRYRRIQTPPPGSPWENSSSSFRTTSAFWRFVGRDDPYPRLEERIFGIGGLGGGFALG